MMNIEFANILKNLMDKAGMTQTELAAKTGLSKPLISRYLAGKYAPKQQNIYLLAKALNVSPEILLGWETPTTEESTKEEKKHNYFLDDETAELAQQLHDDPGLRALMDASRKLKPEELKAVMTLIKTMKGLE